MSGTDAPTKTVVLNRKARHDFEILERFEAGIVLRGTEVKSVRDGKISLQESYAVPKDGELWLEGCSIQPYEHGNIYNHEPTRSRKLLLHKKEMEKLIQKTAEKGLTLVPLAAYFKGGKLKIEIGLARGKKTYDKRESIKKRETERRLKQITG